MYYVFITPTVLYQVDFSFSANDHHKHMQQTWHIRDARKETGDTYHFLHVPTDFNAEETWFDSTHLQHRRTHQDLLFSFKIWNTVWQTLYTRISSQHIQGTAYDNTQEHEHLHAAHRHQFNAEHETAFTCVSTDAHQQIIFRSDERRNGRAHIDVVVTTFCTAKLCPADLHRSTKSKNIFEPPTIRNTNAMITTRQASYPMQSTTQWPPTQWCIISSTSKTCSPYPQQIPSSTSRWRSSIDVHIINAIWAPTLFQPEHLTCHCNGSYQKHMQ